MSAPLKLIMAIPKLRRLTRDEAARRRGVPLAELDEANTFAQVTFADPDPEFPPHVPTEAEREAERERIPKKMAERQRKAEMESGTRKAERIEIHYEGQIRVATFLVDGRMLHFSSAWGERIIQASLLDPRAQAALIFRELLDAARAKGTL